ncbi:MAG: TIR domain-containing protein [bacterium]|nr:TIR domain-containing protein [bacterium]
MSGIFISHSSRDDAAADDVKEWLVEQGHLSVFLDFDPEAGIPAGRSWEQELYQQLRSCRAVIVLCSEHSMASRWCFAEITHARSMGKPIFALIVGPCEVDPVLTDRQILDLSKDRDDAFRRLGRGMALAGIDATNPFDWDGSRSPYPGLLTFSETDAAVFFGRDKEVGEGLDMLTQMRRYGGAALLLVLGASGSGKSSLMRAGLLPRLRRDPDQWLVVDPWRPGDAPADNLAMVLAQAFDRADRPLEWRQLRDRIEANEEGGDEWVGTSILSDLRQAAARPEATVLLFIDQFEELLGQPRKHPANRFLRHLRSALDPPRRSLIVVATVRSDYLGTFQKNPALRGMPFRSLSVGPVAVEGLTDIIRGPASLAGLDVEQSLVQALLADTETEDALPLLAFTLRELYELAQADRAGLGIRDYRDRLGGLQGSVAKAAESVVASHDLAGTDEEVLRGTFLGMVRVDEEGHFARRAMGWRQLSEPARAWLERFVKARLVVARGDEEHRSVEVAHEALFRAWDQLASWLEENREALALRHELDLAVRLWEQAGRSEEDLWRGGRLERALELLETTFDRQPEPREDEGTGGRLPLSRESLEFLRASEKVDRRLQARRRRRRVAVVVASLVVAAMMSVLFVQARAQRNRARTKALAVQSRVHQGDRLDLALLLGLEVGRRGDLFETRRLLYEGLESSPRLETLLRGHEDAVRAVAWSPDGLLLASAAGSEPPLLLWDVAAESPAARPLPGAEAGVWSLAWSPDSSRLAAAAADGSVLVWDVDAPPAEPRRLFDEAQPPKAVYAVRFSPDGGRLAAARSPDHSVQVWDLASSQPAGPLLAGASDQLRSVAWSPDGATVAAAGMDRRVRLWSAETGEPVEPVLTGHWQGVMSVEWSPDGLYLASGSLDGTVGLWDQAPDREPAERRHQRLYPQVGAVTSVAWGGGERILAMAGRDGRLALWDVAEFKRRRPLGPPTAGQTADLLGVAWSPDGSRLASGNGAAVALWRADPAPRLGTRIDLGLQEVRRVVQSPDGSLLAAAGKDPVAGTLVVRVWDRSSGETVREMRGLGRRGPEIAWSGDGRFLYAASSDRTVRRLEVTSGRALEGWQAESESGGRPRRLAWSGDGSRLAAAGRDGGVELWDARSQQLLASTEGGSKARLTSLAWSPGGSRLAAGWQDGGVLLWDGETGQPLVGQPDGHDEEVTSLAWSPDGLTLASGSQDRTVRLWQADTGAADGAPLGGHGQAVSHLAWSPDGRSLSTATNDRQIRLWDMARREVYAGPLSGHEDTITSLFFARDGGTLTSVGRDGVLWHWDVDLDSWRQRVCRLARRNLTVEEWQRYLPWAEPLESCEVVSQSNDWRIR